MDISLQIALSAVAGLIVVYAMGWITRRLLLPGSGNPIIGLLGGALSGALKGHVLGEHHHVAGMAMPGPSDPTALVAVAAIGAAGAALMLLVASLILLLAPNR